MTPPLRRFPGEFMSSKTYLTVHSLCDILEKGAWYLRVGGVLHYDFDSYACCVENVLRKVWSLCETLKGERSCVDAGGIDTVKWHLRNATEVLNMHYDALKKAHSNLWAPLWKNRRLREIQVQILDIYGTLDPWPGMRVLGESTPPPEALFNPSSDTLVAHDYQSPPSCTIISELPTDGEIFPHPATATPAPISSHQSRNPSPTPPQHRSQQPNFYQTRGESRPYRPVPKQPLHNRWGADYREPQ